MQFLHSREWMNAGDVAEVDCSHKCNIMLMDDLNFGYYKSGSRFHYYGGHYDMLPAQIAAPSSGNWNIVLDLGGGGATIRHSIRILRKA